MLADTPTAAQALHSAAVTAGRAPSIGNTQPWQWRLHGDTLDLSVDRHRVLALTDPDRRLAITGLPDAVIAHRVTPARKPSRDFGLHSDMLIAETHNRTAVLAILSRPGDRPLDWLWLRAGEALSPVWLTPRLRDDQTITRTTA